MRLDLGPGKFFLRIKLFTPGIGAIPKLLAEQLKSNLLNKVFQGKSNWGLGLSPACEESKKALEEEGRDCPTLCRLPGEHPPAHAPCSSWCCSADTHKPQHSLPSLPVCFALYLQLCPSPVLAPLISLPHLNALHLSPMNSIFSISLCFSHLSRSLF